MMMHDSMLREGFADPVSDAQAVFRQALAAMSEPGTRHEIQVPASAPEGLAPATYALCLALCDNDTPLWLAPGADTDGIRANLAFHCACPIVRERSHAVFAVLTTAELHQIESFNPGSDRDPHEACTVIVQLDSLDGGVDTQWQGPGICGGRDMQLPLPASFWEQRAALPFPRGVDFFFSAGRQLAGLPRSTRVLCPAQAVY
jgi:alpha-D-ribose 1-methylphosphonate 5-triphosphate synthase subunit PhnH